MYLCFIDESGTPAKPGKAKPKTFVIASVIIPDTTWHSLGKSFERLKQSEAYVGEVKWRYFAPDNTDQANPMLAWPQTRKNAFRSALFKILADHKSVRAVACVCDCPAAYTVQGVSSQNDLYFRTYKPVTERFQYFLQDLSRATGTLETGIIVVDHRGKDDDSHMRLQHERLLKEKRHDHASYANLVETLFFAPSHLSLGVQCANLVAGAVWRQYEHGDPAYFDQIKAIFRRDAHGEIDGYGIVQFPSRGKKTPGKV